MILFQEDWLKEENRGPEGLGPIVDMETKNKSFLEYAYLLHQMGVKNWYFCLALHDPMLQGVDPFDENLSLEMKKRVGDELSANPWYYLREVAKVPAAAGYGAVQFRAHRANIGMFWLFMNNVSFFLLQPRQTGKSVVADMINNYLLHYRMFNSDIFLVTLTQQLLSANIERIKEMRDLLPKYTIQKTSADTKAKELYNYPARKNNYITRVSQSSESAANNIGRGCTTPIQQYDEAAFINYIDVVFPAATAATGAARDLAKERGAPYGTMITTTAGDKMSRSGKYMYEIYQSSADWTEHYFDLQNQEELHKVVRKNSRDGDLMVGATFNHLQLGFDDEWLRGKIAATKTTDQDKINRDYFNIWTAGGALSPLSPEITQDILMSEKHPEYIQITKDGYIVKWYIKPEDIPKYMRENHCIIGSDTSEAINRDATSFVMINITTLETVMVVTVSEADIIKLADFLVNFMVAFPRTTLVMEHKSTAGTFLETLYTKLPLHDIDPYKRIYNTIVQDRDKDPELFKMITSGYHKRNPNFYTQHKKKFGFNTTSQSRHLLYKDVLQLAARRCRKHIYDKVLSAELRSLEVDEKTGRVDHTADKHDDNVIAWLLAMWLLMYGKNLSYYGIENRRVMAQISANGLMVTDTQTRERELVLSYQNDLEEIVKKIANDNNTMYRQVLEHKAKQIQNKLALFGVEVKTLDAMLQDVKEKKIEKLKQEKY